MFCKFQAVLLTVLMLLLIGSNLMAKEIRPTDDINAIRTAILEASDGDVIILERGKVYYSQVTIDVNVNLTIKADETTTGRNPIIAGMVKEDGSKDEQMFFIRGNLTCLNIHFHAGISGHPTGNINRALVFIDKPNLRAVFDGCYFEDFEARTVQLEAPDMRFFATNCIWVDDQKTTGPSEGRSLDLRQFGPDTLFIQNCSFLNVGDRWIRHLPASGRLDRIDYAVIDHCTFINGVNYRPAFDFGHLENLQFTNNIVYNPGILGSDFVRRPSNNNGAFLIAEPKDYFSSDKKLVPWRLSEVFYDRAEGIVVFACHGIDSMNTSINMKNNNCYMDEAIINKLATNDTLHVQKWWCSQFKKSLLGDSAAAFFPEKLNFVKAPKLLVDIVNNYVAYWNQNQKLYMDRVAPDSVDLSYGTTANSYTAAAGGFPLGDLNWYANKKAEWETWKTAIDKSDRIKAIDFELSQNYPNPFNPVTKINYQIAKASRVSVEIYNAIGQKVCTLVNELQNAGSHQISWNGTNDRGLQQPSGIYFCQLRVGTGTSLKKMTLMK